MGVGLFVDFAYGYIKMGSHRGGPDSIPRQSMLTNLQNDRFFSEHLGCPCHYSTKIAHSFIRSINHLVNNHRRHMLLAI